MIYINEPLIWTQNIIDKIYQKHNVIPEEVDEAVFEDNPKCINGISGTKWVFGKTISGRYLFIVLAKKSGKANYKILTARDMEDSERRLYNNLK